MGHIPYFLNRDILYIYSCYMLSSDILHYICDHWVMLLGSMLSEYSYALDTHLPTGAHTYSKIVQYEKTNTITSLNALFFDCELVL